MGTITKIRKFLHKFAPRELSPTRMLEKYASDTKKKGAAVIKATVEVKARKQAEAENLLSAQLDVLDSMKPSPALIKAAQEVNGPPPKAWPKPRANYTPYVAAGLGLAALAIILRKRR